MHHEDLEALRHIRDRRKILARVVAGARGYRWDDREHAGIAGHQRIAVRRRGGDRACADGAAGTGSVLDHDRLAKPRRQDLLRQPRRHVGRATAADGTMILIGLSG